MNCYKTILDCKEKLRISMKNVIHNHGISYAHIINFDYPNSLYNLLYI